jgi:phosphoribosylformylglycinamidine cyclo-ligase
MSHITGGGFTGNIDRVLPGNLDAVVNVDSWETPPLFRFLAETGKLSDRELYRTFNMGIGMVLIVDATAAESIAGALRASGETVHRIGSVVPGKKEVRVVHGS